MLWFQFVIGNGKNICDCTYIDNVVHANLSVESALSSSPASVAGKVLACALQDGKFILHISEPTIADALLFIHYPIAAIFYYK